MPAPVAFGLGCIATFAAQLLGKVLAQVLFNRSAIYPTKEG